MLIVKPRKPCFQLQDFTYLKRQDSQLARPPENNKQSDDWIMEYDSLVILLCPGSWHTTSHYDSFVTHAKSLNVRVDVARPPSDDGRVAGEDFEIYVRNASQQLQAWLKEDKSVLLLAHSYGGFIACEAAAAASTVPTGRLLGIMFATAFAPEYGRTFADLFADGPAQSWMTIEGTKCFVHGATELFYNQVKEPMRTKLAASLVPSSTSLWLTPILTQEWKQYPCYYIKCGKDQIMTTAITQANIDRIPGVKVLDLPEGDHFPFESCTKELMETVLSIARESMDV